ncbi:serine hydrolase domain-containing protein [Noviherbaspirillum sp. 1P10PC]|uniref:serine hydrolase domain-containing protein n=1 Tax=Noviherbaspirillum sp. 1P10PC TaxID=3132292 RepID=UPI00399F8383
MRALDLRSAIIQVSVDGRQAYSTALGESAPGTPATTAMHFRNGAVAMTYMATVLLQLVDDGRLSLGDKVGKWLPGLPAADQVTLEMLVNNTSGYPDYVADPEFLAATKADPLREWTAGGLMSYAFNKGLIYPPGANWNYSHTNYLVLAAVIEKVTGKPLAEVLRGRILDPLGLRNTASSVQPDIPSPVLRAYTSERGSYEESTFWNPSWTLPAGAVMTTDITDLRLSAEAIMRGTLLSSRSFSIQTDGRLVGFGDAAGCPPGICRKNTEAAHYGMGLLLSGPWLMQSPMFGGYSASIGMLPERGISIAVAATQGPQANPDRNGSEALMLAIARQVAPDRPVPLSALAR